MFPLSDSAKASRFPIITLILILINIYVFYLEMTASSLENFIYQYALIPSLVDPGNPTTLIPFVTSMFLHGSFFHIISNMWFLWIFGDNVEGHFGKFWYPIVFLLSGIAGGILQFIFMPDSSIPMLGASGAVSGVLGAYFVLFPHSRIKTFLFLFFIITIVEIRAVFYLFYWFFLQVFSGLTDLGSLNVGGGVAFWAHVGGFVMGVILAKVFASKENKGYVEGEIVG